MTGTGTLADVVSDRDVTHRVAAAAGGHRRHRRCSSPAAPRTRRRTRGSRPDRTPRRSRTCSGRSSPSPGWSSSSSPLAVGWAIFRYRDRGQPIPKQTHGRPTLEIGLTILPALILIGIAIPTVGTIFALAKTDDTECYVNVTGQQWWWEIDYPVQDGCGGITEPIVTSGQMVIPTGTKVLVRGTSRDVIHSWWIPRLNGKRDMVPGRVQTVRMEADEPGIYAGQCTEFCGLSHANMRMEVVALTPADFETWKQRPAGAVPAAGGGLAGRRG